MPRRYPHPEFEMQELLAFAREMGATQEQLDNIEFAFCCDAPEWDVYYAPWQIDDLEDSYADEFGKKVMREFIMKHGDGYAVCILK